MSVIDFDGLFAYRTKLALEAAGAKVDILLFEDLDADHWPVAETSGIVLSACQLGDFYALDPKALSLPVPMLGICNGAQLMAQALGGDIARLPMGAETGPVLLHQRGSILSAGLPSTQIVHMYHEYQICELPRGLTTTASSARCSVAAFESVAWPPLIGVQFHPEHHETVFGSQMLSRFVRICRVHSGQSRNPASLLNLEASE